MIKIKGSLVVSSESLLLDKSHPNHAMGMPVNPPDLADWSGEVANQILGRVKNKVSQFGTTFSMATPTTVVGKRMHINMPKDGSTMSVSAEGPHGTLQVLLIATLDPTLVLDASKASDTAKEGEAILF